MPRAASVLWLRRDLRRGDLPALGAAASAADGGNVLVLFVLDPALWDGGGPARRAWLAATLEAAREAYDGRLCLRVGDPAEVVPAVVEEVGARSVHVSRETTPAGVRRDRAVSASLAASGVDWVETGTPYAVGPGSIVNGSGDPYKVFTPFSRAWRDHGWPAPATEPQDLSLARVASDDDGWKTVREALSVDGLPAMPEAGEAAGHARWRD